jgi:hypothetical protein
LNTANAARQQDFANTAADAAIHAATQHAAAARPP